MKSDEVKTSSGFEVIKAKALQFPLDILDVKPSVRSSFTPANAVDAPTPSLYALRFFSTSSSNDALKSRLSKSRAKLQTSESSKDRSEPHLSPVELTIKKKIKFPYDKKRLQGKENQHSLELSLSDREIIEELRHRLRSQQPRHGTTSVLEAIGDPQVREQRLYYEPLKTFLQGRGPENRINPDNPLPIVNIMVPSFEKGGEPNSGVLLPLTLSRHNAAVSRNASRFRGGASVTLLPKVVGNSVAAATNNSWKLYESDLPSSSRETNVPSKRRTQFVLPRIGLKRDEDELEEKMNKRKKVAVSESQQRNKAASTVQLPDSMQDETFRAFNGFPRRATTTATGKAHLIGPMNKMDMIADYSKALQNGLITYNDYMKKLSVLSLHKVPLGKSVQRHFHLVRDGSNNMKPKLAHVDLSSKSTTQISSMSSEQSDSSVAGQRPAAIRDKSKTVQGMYGGHAKSLDWNESSLVAQLKTNQSQVHRVDIGEGLSLFEKPTSGPDMTEEIIVPDLTRYTHVHHPRQGRLTQYHWNHESAYQGTGFDPWSSKHWQSSATPKLPNKFTSQKSYNTSKEEKSMTESQAKILLSMEEYLQMRSPESANGASKQNKPKPELLGSVRLEDALLSEDLNSVKMAEENFNYIGKLPEPPSESEPTGLGAKEILRTVNFKLPNNNSVPKEEIGVDDQSDLDSVFQEHLDNMLRTIKKAKANQKQKVPELRGLAPTVIPQVLVQSVEDQENGAAEGGDSDPNADKPDSEFLGIHRNVPKNSPPPSARKSSTSPENLVASDVAGGQSADETLAASVITVIPPAHAKVITERFSAPATQIKPSPQPKTPKSVQSSHSSQLGVPKTHHDDPSDLYLNNSEVRVMTASVDLIVPSSDDDVTDGSMTDRSRLEVVITSVPVAPPASVATTSDETLSERDAEAE